MLLNVSHHHGAPLSFGASAEGDRVHGLEALLPHGVVVLALPGQHVVALTCSQTKTKVKKHLLVRIMRTIN